MSARAPAFRVSDTRLHARQVCIEKQLNWHFIQGFWMSAAYVNGFLVHWRQW